MKYFLCIILALPFTAGAQLIKNTVKTDSLNGRPVYYYLNHEDVGSIAKSFYSGQLGIGDNEETKGIIDSIFTDDEETLPFFLYNFNRLLAIADKTTVEDAGTDAKDFILKNPCFFFKSLRDAHFHMVVKNWVQPIGYTIGTRKALDAWTGLIEPVLLANCKQYLPDWNNFKAQLAKEIS